MKTPTKTRRVALAAGGAVALILSIPGGAIGQAPTGAPQAPTRAQQVPLSGRQATGSVVPQESSVPGGAAASVNTINTNVLVQGAYQGSVPDQSFSGDHITLTLPEAIRRALQFNIGALGANNSERQIKAERVQSLSNLLPNVNATLSITQMKSDLEAIGLTAATIPGPFGANLPRGTRPFHYYDTRATASQSIFDGTALNNYRSSKSLAEASSFSQKDAREMVILAAGGQYLRTLSASALVTTQQAQVQYAQASYDQASAQYKAGTKAAVDTQRSLVELQTERQRLTSNRADLRKQQLILSRIVGLPLRVEVAIAEQLRFREESVPAVAEVLAEALAHRADLQAAGEQLKAAEKSLAAARFERVPTVSASGYYGLQGINPDRGIGVYGVTGTVNVPIFNGGRTRADVEQASAAVAQRRVEYLDQQQIVELDVRDALIDLEVSAEQVQVAQSNQKLAIDTLKQSQDRFVEGVATSVEVVQSTEALAAAENDYVNSVYSNNVAKLSLARATGTLETVAPNLLKEQQ